MTDLFLEAGYAIWFVAAAGLAAIFFAVRYARTLDRSALAVAGALGVATLLLGALGTALGVQLSAHGVASTPERWVFLLGLRESLHNLVLALALDTAVALAVAVAHLRPRARDGSAAAAAAPRVRATSGA